jgi:hypothetical protein
MAEQFAISRRHPWIGAPRQPAVVSRPRPLLQVHPHRLPSGGRFVIARPARSGQAARPWPLRITHPDRRQQHGHRLAARPPRETEAAPITPVLRLFVWLTVEDRREVRLAYDHRLHLELTYEDRLALTLMDHSHAG